MMNSVPLYWLIALLLAASAGLFLLISGIRARRTGTTPHCRRCTYILTGLAAARCPECGADVSDPTAIVVGTRVIRRGRLGVAVALLGLVVCGVVTLAIGHFQKIDWYTLRPTAWVLDDLLSEKPEFVARALRESCRRLIADELSPDQVTRLAEFCLAQQAQGDVHGGLHWDVERTLEALHTRTLLTPSQTERFLDNMGVVTFRARPQIVLGQSCPTDIQLSCYGASSGFSVGARLKELMIDGVSSTAPRGEWYAAGLSHGWSGELGNISLTEAGEHVIACRIEVSTYAGYGAREAAFRDLGSPTEPLRTRTIVVTQRVHVHAQEPPDLFRAVSSPSLDAAVRAALKVETMIQSDRLYIWIRRESETPVSLAFDVTCGIGDDLSHTWSVVFPNQPWGTNRGEGHGYPLELSPLLPSTLTVVMRSSRKAAEETTNVFEIWDGEIRFENVPIATAEPRPTSAPSVDSPDRQKPRRSIP
jgi:hypothetical protein